MTKSTNPIFISAFSLFFILLLHLSSMSAEEVGDQRDFDYIEWSPKGPRNWGDLKAEWAACKNGRMQSPIDISRHAVTIDSKYKEAKMSYKPSNATLKNRGHDIAVYWSGDAGSIQVDGIEYALIQSHFHSPSEHSVNRRRYDLELHMVHANLNMSNKIAVVALFYTIGEPDAFLTKLRPYVSSMEISKNQTFIGSIDPRDQIKTSGNSYYRYAGSLTTPPCTESVTWIIGEKVTTVSKEQVKLLREAVQDFEEMDARPKQKHRHRTINKIFIN